MARARARDNEVNAKAMARARDNGAKARSMASYG